MFLRVKDLLVEDQLPENLSHSFNEIFVDSFSKDRNQMERKSVFFIGNG